jgi:hypothetical protein
MPVLERQTEKKQWVKPQLRRLVAGDARHGDGIHVDHTAITGMLS